MKNLDNLEEIKKLDPKNVYGSTQMLSQQCKQVWDFVKAQDIKVENVKNILICGMGGSAYGGHVALSLFRDQLKVPMVVLNDYHVPSFVDSSTLVIVTSYSGTTEESLSCLEEAKQKQAQAIVLTSGGLLKQLSEKGYANSVLFSPEYNPSGQPRLGTGYIVLGTIAILNKLDLIKLDDDSVQKAIEELDSEKENIEKSAKELATKIQGNIPLIIAAEFLEGNAHIMRNQINETAKSFSDFALLPELNHHLMEGLKNPVDRKLVTLFLTSDLYSGNISKRIDLTKDVVEKNGVAPLEYVVKGEDKLSQMLNVLSFGAYLSFYLAILYDQDPSVIPWVDYFKEQLHKNS